MDARGRAPDNGGHTDTTVRMGRCHPHRRRGFTMGFLTILIGAFLFLIPGACTFVEYFQNGGRR